MSPWHREALQMFGASVAAVGLALLVLAFHGPLVASGALLALLGSVAVAVGYVGLLGPPPKAPAEDVDPVQALLARTRENEAL